MKYCVSTFKSSPKNHLRDENTSAITNDLSFSSSTFGFHNDDCAEYGEFLEELEDFRLKIENNDLNDFVELE